MRRTNPGVYNLKFKHCVCMQRRQKSTLLHMWSGHGPRVALILVLLICLGSLLPTHAAITNDGLLHMKQRRGKGSRQSSRTYSPETPRISLLTPFGPIRISLLSKNAPVMTKALLEEAKKRKRTCGDCKFYRADDRASKGPPYGLLQGSLGKGMQLPKAKEGSRSIQAGDVVILPPSNDFYIALQDHPDWSSAHTVVGTVDDFVSIDLIGVQPTFRQIHPQFSTEMQMLKDPVDFVLTDDMAEMIMPKFAMGSHIKTMPLEQSDEYEYEYVDDGEEKGYDGDDDDQNGINPQRVESIKAPGTQRKIKPPGRTHGAINGEDTAGWNNNNNNNNDDTEDDMTGFDQHPMQRLRQPPHRQRPGFGSKRKQPDSIRPPDIRNRRKKRMNGWKDDTQEWEQEEQEPEQVY